MPDITVTRAPTYQGITLWPGDGEPLDVHDNTTAADIDQCVASPIMRAVLAARLRAAADLLAPRGEQVGLAFQGRDWAIVGQLVSAFKKHDRERGL